MAANEGCNHVEYIGTIEGVTHNRDIFSISEVDKNGLSIPTGLPVLILWDEENANIDEIVTGAHSLKILSLFE